MLTWDAYPGKKLDALAFSPCGRALALGGRNLACRLIDAGTGSPLWTVRARCDFTLSLGFAPDGSVLCRGAGLSTARRWDASGAGAGPSAALPTGAPRSWPT